MKIFIDGQYLDKADAKISVFDHGLLYGDGIFEGIRIYNGRVFLLDEHLDRLWDSAKAIMLNIPMTYEEIKEATLECCRLNGLKDGYIRLVVTRGVGNLGINPEKCPKATVFIIADTISLYPEECYTKGLRVNTAATQRINVAAWSPAIKSLNYLNNILAKIEGNLYGAQETVMLNQDGYVAECTGDNIFVLKKGEIFTPPIYAGALGGLTRKVIFDLAKSIGKTVVETNLTRYDLFVADEIFLTGSGAEVVPVYEVDGRTIGSGHVGPVTEKLMALFKDLTRSTGVEIYKS
ncbi:branched-chain-amino-acid transaminase [Verrucomicrobia bacterium LW23]|nr:branched-chain-amino-acid transaminase [Verrucomicrobia bacterium LW23]PTY04433.1 branched-chain-amino-acid transaminase [Verrucomicrobia bacterium LW23]